MNFTDYEILGFNLGGLFLVLPLIFIFIAILWNISSKDIKPTDRNPK
jgi:hypothetical protein